MQGLMLHAGAEKLARQDLLALPVPEGTDTHTVIPHPEVVQAVVDSLAYRRIEVVKDEYGISKDGMRMFGFMTLNINENGVALGLAIRNSHDKTFSLGMVAGYRVFVCDNLAFRGDFVAMTRKHSKNINLIETVALGVDRAQRHFDQVTAHINAFQNHQLPDVTAREIIYHAFIGDQLDAPKHLARRVHQEYFEPRHPEFEPRTLWSLENAFTESFKALDPIPQYQATAKLAPFLGRFN